MGNWQGWGPREAGSVSVTEPGRDLRSHGVWALRFRDGAMRRGVVKWLRYRILRIRKALRCHLAPLPKVAQLISVIECAWRSAAMPSSNLRAARIHLQFMKRPCTALFVQ